VRLTLRQKLLAVNALIAAGLTLTTLLHGWAGATTLARVGLAGAAVAALVAWTSRRAAGTRPLGRLDVVERRGLSPRTALALVEVDGRSLLVIHGDGFAQVHLVPPGGPPPAELAGLRSLGVTR
jgi:hypothetical protein